jgi:Na+/proline symporter
MHWSDWTIIAGYIVVVTAIGLLFRRRASGSVADFFVAGRNLPWWIAGTSLVATSFAADTPLAITEIVAEKGLAGNWLWWNQIFAWMLAVAFFARLWRRSGLITDAELVELRYGGPAAAFLRGFKAFYHSVIQSTWTLAWVMLAMQKIVREVMAEPAWVTAMQESLEAALGIEPGAIDLWKWIVLVSLFIIATFYTVVSGYWGIVITDLIQFAIAMGASIMFAFYALDEVGGIAALHAGLVERFGADGARDFLQFMPAADSQWMPMSTFLIFLGVSWWGDCGGFAAQRMFSTRSDRDSTLAALWYAIAHFAIRPWPWIIVALVTLVVYPDLKDTASGYPKLMMEILPAGLRGLMIASLLAAFMSTVDTHLNWNASYFVNDVYKRFIAPGADEKSGVRAARWSTVAFAALAIVIAYFLNSIKDAWVFLINLQAGIGLVLMLRWVWWRINVWSEISALAASLVFAPSVYAVRAKFELDWSDAFCILLTVSATTLVCLIVTYATPPTDDARLEKFFRKVRPDAGVWGRIARRCPDVPHEHHTWRTLIYWLAGALALALAMFGIGQLSLGVWGQGAAMLGGGIAIAAGLLLARPKASSPSVGE